MPMGIDYGVLSRFVPEVILTVIFGLFVLKLLDRQDKRDVARDGTFIAALEKRDSEWRAYMADDRDRHGANIGRIAEEVKTLAGVVGGVQALLVQHDTWVRMEVSRGERKG